MEYPEREALPLAESLAVVLPEGAAPDVDGVVSANLSSSDYYFASYSHFGIHEEMIKDEVRTKTYMRAILDNAHLFAGKVVLDVGAGTGILSLFAARAGAAKVYAIECAAIAQQARMIVKMNHFDRVIEVVNGRVEDVALPRDPATGHEAVVDIIISEWMGYFLFYESMLQSVLYARDRWLRPKGGYLFPDGATLFLCGIEDASYRREKIDFWDNVYGFDFSCIKRMALTEPLVDYVDPDQIVTDTCPVLRLDLQRLAADDLDWSAPFRITAERDDFVHALVVFFDVHFGRCHRPLTFSTGPCAPQTHWKQTVMYLDRALPLLTGECVEGTLACRRNQRNPRDLDIGISYRFQGARMKARKILRYRMH
jgi:protein arginine N-methyltransferase 1